MTRRHFLTAFTAAAVGLATGMGLRAEKAATSVLDGDTQSDRMTLTQVCIDSDMDRFRRYQEIHDRKMFEMYQALAQRTEFFEEDEPPALYFIDPDARQRYIDLLST